MDPSTALAVVALDETPLEQTPGLDLPFDNWSFAIWVDGWEPGHLVLRGGPLSYQGYLDVDVSGAAPEIVRYHAASP